MSTPPTSTNAPGSLEHPAAHHESATRKPISFWDRVKILLLCGALFGLFVWHDASSNPILPLGDAVNRQLDARWWLLAVVSLELLRQSHYLLSEVWAGWHHLWSHRIFGGLNRRTGRMNDWTRYRIGRVIRIVIALVVVDLVLASLFDLTPSNALIEAPARLFDYLPLFLQLVFAFFFVIIQMVGLFWFLSRGGVDVYMPDDIDTRFTDVWGQDAVVERVKENIVFLEDPESIEAKGGYVPSGLLLWGPPGTGKTLMAEAVAGETGKPYVFVDPGAFNAMFMGVGIMKVKSLFKKLRKLAMRYGGVIVFFDEADSLGNRGQLAMPGGAGGGFMSPKATPFGGDGRPACNGLGYLTPESQHAILRDGFIMGGMGGGGGMGTLQALLSELSGLKKPRGFLNRYGRRLLGMKPKPPPKYRILVMMATNLPQALDEALLRPGRIDRIYKVGYPSKVGRIRTYEGYLAKVAHTLTAEQVDKLATITPYATGATIKDLVNEALITAIRDGREVIEWRDVIKAKQLKDLGPPEDVEYIERERHAVALHEACHALVAYRARHHLTIDIATIEKGGNYLGMVASIPPEDQFTRWRTEYEADIMVSLASLAGERMFFEGDNSSGVSGDLESATFLATYMEGYWGMGSTVASHGVTHRVGVGGGGKPGSAGDGKDGEKDLLSGTLGSRIEEKLAELLARTERMLAENRHHVFAIAHALETNKTLTGDDVEAIVEGHRGPLIDGRMYHEPEFADLAERYHRDAVLAHKGHTRPTLGLPMPTVWWHDAHADAVDEPPYANGQEPAETNGADPIAGVASAADVERSAPADED